MHTRVYRAHFLIFVAILDTVSNAKNHDRAIDAPESPKAPLWLIIASASVVLGIGVNMIISGSVWDTFRAMFDYVHYGYFSGFIISTLFLPIAIGTLIVCAYDQGKGKASSSRVVPIIIGSVLLLAFVILFVVCWNAPVDEYYSLKTKGA